MASSTTPVAVVCVGMAGSGKTTFMQRINSYLHGKRSPPYVLNLDPAVKNVPFESNIDIRDSVNYKEVMKQYNLGPNGGILTSLNLFATKVDQIINILEKRTQSQTQIKGQTQKETQTQTQTQSAGSSQEYTGLAAAETASSGPSAVPISHILVDTPGQIEVFVWSASGEILLGSLASAFPTVIAYIIDTPRTASTSTFMSNMLYACSILYKTKLPMILVFNKTDVKDAAFAKEWMTDFEAFQAALKEEEENGGLPAGGDEAGGYGATGSGYMSSLLHSMSLVLEEFYNHLSVVGVSSMTGEGVEEFFAAVQQKKEEFDREYKPELERQQRTREEQKTKLREKELGRLLSDLNVKGGPSKTKRKSTKPEPETVSEAEDESDDAEYGVVERDEDEDGTDEDHVGLTQRYKEAVDERRQADGDDFSFAKYIHSANLG
jgi:GTPase SAR1 family protein